MGKFSTSEVIGQKPHRGGGGGWEKVETPPVPLGLNLIVFVTARDIHGLLTLSSRLQIHKYAIEIALNLKQGFKGAKYRIIFVS